MSAEDVVLLLVLAAVAALVVLAVVRARRFGGLAAAFSRSDKQQRAELAAAQKSLRAAQRQRDTELAPRRKAAEDAVAAYEQRVAAARSALALAREPGPGRQLTGLGPVVLHEHVVRVNGSAVPLSGLEVAVQSTGTLCTLFLMFPDGRRTSQPFSTEWRVDDKGRQWREFDEAQVQQLADAVHNATVLERQFRAQQPQRIAEAERALHREAADTAQLTLELARLDEATVTVGSTDAALDAHERLYALEDAWMARRSTRKQVSP